MAEVSRLTIALAADLRDLGKGLKKAGRLVKKFGDGVASRVGTVATRAFQVAAAAAAGFTAAVLKAVGTTDELVKTANRLGIAVSQLQALQGAAAGAGVDINLLNNGLQKMKVRISEAARGTGEAVNAMKELNLNTEELLGLDTEAQFQKIAAAIDGVANANDKARLATKFFEEEGVRLLGLMDDLSGKTALAAARLDEFGGALSEEDVARVNVVKGAFEELKVAASSFIDRALVQLAPVLELAAAAATAFFKTLTENLPSGETMIIAFFRTIGFIEQSWLKVKLAFSEMTVAMLRGLAMLLVKVEDFVINFTKVMSPVLHLLGEEFGAQSSFVTKALESILQKAYELEQGHEELREEIEATIGKYEGMAQAGVKTFETQTQAALDLIEKLKLLREQQGKGTKDTDEFNKGMHAKTQAMQAAAQAANSLGQFLGKLASKTKNSKQAQKELEEQLIKTAIAAAGSIIGGFAGGAFGAQIGGSLAGGFANTIEFQKGGIVNTPTALGTANRRLAVGGEAGPEAVIPLQRDSRGNLGVVSNQEVVVNINGVSDFDSFRKSRDVLRWEMNQFLDGLARRGDGVS